MRVSFFTVVAARIVGLLMVDVAGCASFTALRIAGCGVMMLVVRTVDDAAPSTTLSDG